MIKNLPSIFIGVTIRWHVLSLPIESVLYIIHFICTSFLYCHFYLYVNIFWIQYGRLLLSNILTNMKNES